MPLKSLLSTNFLLVIAGLSICLLLNAPSALLATVIILGLHSRYLKAQEWRIIIQLSVLGWVVNMIFLRMGWVEINSDVSLINRVCCWTVLATGLCHSLYPLMKNLTSAALLGACWGVIYFVVPVLSQQYMSVLSWPLLLSSATIAGMLTFFLASFIVTTRILPQT